MTTGGKEKSTKSAGKITTGIVKTVQEAEGIGAPPTVVAAQKKFNVIVVEELEWTTKNRPAILDSEGRGNRPSPTQKETHMETKLVEAYFVQKETFYHSFEVPVDMSDDEVRDYILMNEETFWNEARSCEDVSTELDEINEDYFENEAERLRESGDFITWEDEEDVED